MSKKSKQRKKARRRKRRSRPHRSTEEGLSRVPHRTRGEVPSVYPLHIISRLVKGLPSMRRKKLFRVIRGALRDKCRREGFRLVHFSVQGDHLHFVVEARDRKRLSCGMQSVLITIAKRLNSWLGRKGRVVERRFQARLLKTAKDVRDTLAYVLCNARRHDLAVSDVVPDDRSSGPWFDGWKDYLRPERLTDAPVARARTWLLTVGWRRWGRIPIDHRPGVAAPVGEAA